MRLSELLGATLDLQECSTEFPGTLRGALGELSGSSWGVVCLFDWDPLATFNLFFDSRRLSRMENSENC